MKITDVSVMHLRIEHPNISIFDGTYDTCVIVVETDEGITGLGETDSMPEAVRGVIEGPSAHKCARALKEVLLGESPLEPELLWKQMYDATEYVGRRGIVMHAIGAIDIALWDIKGKAASKPIHELLGGRRHDRIAVYGTIYPLSPTVEGVARQIEDARSLNLHDFKLCADPWWMDDLENTRDLLGAARQTAGPAARIIIDAATICPTYEDAMRLVPLLQEIDTWFLEAPLPLDDFEGHRRMANSGMMLGVGDMGFTHVCEFLSPVGDVGTYWQPDITHTGFTGIRAIELEARPKGKIIVPHSHKTTVALAACLQYLAAYEEDTIVEYSTSKSPLRWETTVEALPVELDGTVIVPTSPGLGVTVNEHTVMSYPWNRSGTPAGVG